MQLRYWFILAALIAAAPSRAETDDDERGERDDARARLLERRQRFGTRTPEQSLRILGVAHKEAQRWGIGASQQARPAALSGLSGAAQRASGTAWINLGPTNAAFEKNGITMTKVDSGRVNRIVAHPTDPNIVYVVTSGGGVWKTFDALTDLSYTTGPHWTPVTDSLGTLSMGSMALDPSNPDTLVLGLGDAFDVQIPGLVHSSDGGATWSDSIALKGTYPGYGEFTATSVRDVQFDQASTGVVLAATDAGLFRSQQAGIGADWKLVDLSADHAPQECWSATWIGSQTWLVACEAALFRSTDGGASWVSVKGGLPSSAQPRVHRMTAVAARSDSANPQAARVYVLAAAADVIDPSTGAQGWGTLDVFRSDDGGRTFHGLGVNNSRAPTNPNADQTDLDVLHGQAWYNQMLEVDPRDRDWLLIGGNLSLLRSRDGGTTWDVMTNWLPGGVQNPQSRNVAYAHADWHAGTASYAGGTLSFYGGTDGGVFRSRDVFAAAAGSASFDDGLNRGIVTHLAYSVGTDENDSTNALVLGGLQDNGTRMRAPQSGSITQGPTVFNQVWGGDGVGVAVGRFHATDAGGTLLVVTNPYSLQRSQDSGQSFAKMTSGLPVDADGNLPGGNFFMKAVSDFADAKNHTFLTVVNLAGGGARIYRWVDTGSANNSWADITATITLRAGGTAPTFAALNNLAADPRHSGQYGAVSYNKAYVKAPGAATWTESAATPLGSLSSIAFDPAALGTIWVASADGGAGAHVFVSVDGGATWQARGGTGQTALPALPANVVKVDPNDSKTIYVGTEIGLYRSIDAGATWARHGTGMPLVSVTDLSIALDSTAIRAATFGRGFWELYPSFAAPVGVPGNGDFDHNQQIDGFDLVAMSAVLGLTVADPAYTATGNLVGTANAIDGADLQALIAKLGGRP